MACTSSMPSRLSGLKIHGSGWNDEDEVYDVASPHALAQAAGYLKYVLREKGGVYFRGQTELYPKMLPGLYRDITLGAKSQREAALGRFIRSAVGGRAFLSGTPAHAHEPLLQHYGIRTRWLDLVDNVWVALWFACNAAAVVGDLDRFVHYVPSEEEFAYVVLLQPGPERSGVGDDGPSPPGQWLTGQGATVIDLRRAAPSLYLRPHAQHGLLFRRTKYPPTADAMDLSEFIVGVIRVRRELASAWLGDGFLTRTHHLFPPPLYDYGYRALLKSAPAGNDRVGAIQHIGA